MIAQARARVAPVPADHQRSLAPPPPPSPPPPLKVDEVSDDELLYVELSDEELSYEEEEESLVDESSEVDVPEKSRTRQISPATKTATARRPSSPWTSRSRPPSAPQVAMKPLK
jgi:hypothetical protein